MRAYLFIALAVVAAAAPLAHAEDAGQPPTGVTVNMGALPTQQPKVPMPRHKPSADEMRALTVPMPRHKPDPASLAAETPATTEPATTAATAEAPAVQAPSTTATAPGTVPMPRPKPGSKLAAKEPKEPKAPVIGTEASPAPPAPMTSPQGAADIASALRGSTMAPPTVDPTAGFAVLTQVHFQSGRTELGADAKAALDGLATRLLANEERVRLAAFSGAPGDMSSEARRLSLERAIAVRAYLESKGVPASRVDLLSFGGAVHGASDRVDVLIRST